MTPGVEPAALSAIGALPARGETNGVLNILDWMFPAHKRVYKRAQSELCL